MRLILVSLGIAVFGTKAAHAQLLSYKEILDSVEGYWGIPYQADDNEVIPLRCDQTPLKITLSRLDNRIIYESNLAGDDFIERSDVSPVSDGAGGYAPCILLQYEGEDRLTEAGEPVQWRLIMTDRDTFYWQRADWDFSMFTAPRVRCPVPDQVS